MTPDVKPGVQTSEFWLMLVTNILAFVAPLLSARIDASTAWWAPLAGAALAAINSGIYTYNRMKVKTSAVGAQQNAQLSQQLAGLLAGVAAAGSAGVHNTPGTAPGTTGQPAA